jgi:energy-coupling factor transport system ATP-binding protein
MSTISAHGWGWRHAGRRAWAVRGLDLEIAGGESVLLLGPSGAGKSTLLAAVAGLLDDGPHGTGESEGQLLVDGVPARRAREDAVSAGFGTARTGLLLQDPSAQTVLSRCGDDVAFGLENHGVPAGEIWGRVDEALAAVGPGVGRAHPTARLSGGQRQRLALAGVLALRPGILLLDEPTAMLDPLATTDLRDVVARLVRSTGATALVVEHRVDTWLDVVDRVVVLEPGGGAMADGPARAVLAEHGPWLAERGVWVPGATAGTRPRAPGGPRTPLGAEPAPLLAAEGVAVGRPGRRGPVVRDVDLQVHAGRAAALTGSNGAGKSTLALALGGLARPFAGRVRAGTELRAGRHTHAGRPGAAVPTSRDPMDWGPRQLVGRIGSVFQDPQTQFVAATVADELAVGPLRLGAAPAEVAERVGDLLERMRLAHLSRANPFTLSGGEQRRLSVATALATRPRVLVLDEPTFGQDLRTWGELVGLLRALLDDGTAVVMATHDEALVRVLADDVLHLSGGRVSDAAAGALPRERTA